MKPLQFIFLVMLNYQIVTCEVVLRGDVTVAGLFQIQNEDNNQCSGIAPLSVKILEAVKWTFRKLNDKNYIPGVTIGFEAWPTCQILGEAIDRTDDLITRIRNDKNDTSFTAPPLVALIGPNLSEAAQKTSVLLSTQRTEDRLLQLGFSATASSLSNINTYSNFFRVVPSDSVQIEVMVALMTELQWNYIAIIHDEDVYGTEGKTSLVKRAAEKSICVAKTVALSSGPLNFSDLTNMLQAIIQFSESPISGVVVLANENHVTSILSVASTLKNRITDPTSFILSEAVGLSDNYFKDINGNLYEKSKGVYVVFPPQNQIKEFEDYWEDTFHNVSKVVEESKSNSWLRSMYKSISGCLPSTNPSSPGCPELTSASLNIVIQKSSWISYAVKVAYVVAKILKDTHNAQCYGQPGLCTNMKNTLYKNKGSLIQGMNGLTVDFDVHFPFVPDAFKNISFTFPGVHDAVYKKGLPDYEVYHYRRCLENEILFCFEKIGTYADTILTLNKTLIRDYHTNSAGSQWPNVTSAQCAKRKRCTSCISSDIPEKIYFKDGDLLVGGIVPVYNTGTGGPLSCGSIRTSLGTEIVQALEYAVDLLNRKNYPFEQFFPGKSVGFFILNSCNQPLLIQNKLITLLKNGLTLNNGTVVDISSKLIGYVGPYGSSESIAASSVLSKFGYVQISYASTAVSLSNRVEYPYFMRVCTPDDKQTRGMMKIIRHSIYKSSYIQVIYSTGTYGEAGRDAIRQAAKEEKVCIANEISFSDADNPNAIIDKLRVHSFAKIVILFVMSQQVSLVVNAIHDKMDYGEFMIIGSEAWGYRPSEFTDKTKLAGSLIMSLRMSQNGNFTAYLRTIDLAASSPNPWFREYVQNKFNCYLPTSFDKTFSNECPKDLQLAASATYQQDIWTPFALNAMVALISGSSDAFLSLCGINSPTLCEQYKMGTNTVWKKILAQKRVDGSGNVVRLFDDNGDGNVGYTIYNLQLDRDNTNKVIYKEVGKYSVDGSNFVLDVNNIQLPDRIALPSDCPNPKACQACEETSNNTTAAVSSEANSAAVPALAAVVGVCVVIVLILVAFILLMYRRGKAADKEDYNYLSVVSDIQRPYSLANNEPNNMTQMSSDSLQVQFENSDSSIKTQSSQLNKRFVKQPSVTNELAVPERLDSTQLRESYLNPISIKKDTYFTPRDGPTTSDTDLKKVSNDCLDPSTTSLSSESSMQLSETVRKPINSPKIVAGREVDSPPPLSVTDFTDMPPPSSHMPITSTKQMRKTPTPHPDSQVFTVSNITPDGSPPLPNSNRKPPQVAIVPAIPNTQLNEYL